MRVETVSLAIEGYMMHVDGVEHLLGAYTTNMVTWCMLPIYMYVCNVTPPSYETNVSRLDTTWCALWYPNVHTSAYTCYVQPARINMYGTWMPERVQDDPRFLGNATWIRNTRATFSTCHPPIQCLLMENFIWLIVPFLDVNSS